MVRSVEPVATREPVEFQATVLMFPAWPSAVLNLRFLTEACGPLIILTDSVRGGLLTVAGPVGFGVALEE